MEKYSDDAPALRQRLDRLGKTLEESDQATQKAKTDDLTAKQSGSAMNQGMQAMSGFVATVVVCAAIGWGIDRQFGISPWALIIMIAFGTCAGLWNVYRVASNTKTGQK